MNWSYEKLVDGKIKQCPMNDKDASITGSFVFGLKAWFDENPQKARELGWIKHIHPDKPKFNSHTHYLMVNTKTVDEYTL